jgi:hypothetical protein
MAGAVVGFKLCLGCPWRYLIVHAILRVRRCDALIDKLKKKHSAIAQFI